jgi:thioredoxin-like negative regulator of GroEL
MAIAPVTSSASNILPQVDSLRQTFGQLTSALQSGDLSAAQSAYSTVSQAVGSNPNSPFAQALAQIGDALQSGDVGKAQAALATLQQQMQAAKGAPHHHGHHHHAGGSSQTLSVTAAASTSSDPVAATGSTNLVDVTA